MKINELDQPDDLKRYLNAFAASPRGFLMLSGDNGLGKSFCALAAYNAFSPYKLPAYDHDIAWLITQANLNVLWQKFNIDGHSTLSLLDNMVKTKMLILDDLGTRRPTEAFADFLYAIVDGRYCNRFDRGTIITTNKTIEKLRDYLGDAIVSRIASGKCFKFEGEDRRFNPKYKELVYD